MNATQETGTLLKKSRLAPGIWSFDILSPAIAALADTGQFVTVCCAPYLLRRPISLAGFDSRNGTLHLVFEVRGKGTAWLSEMKEGESIDLLGPLGRGFEFFAGKRAVLVGGGIGTPPLLPLAEKYGSNAAAVIGFRSRSAVILEEDFREAGNEVTVCTDDGSAGFPGLCTDALTACLARRSADVLYTCGPRPMMEKVAKIAAEHAVPCYVSLEERMACGVGACLGCVCRTKSGGKTGMSRVCADGPVFDAREVFDL